MSPNRSFASRTCGRTARCCLRGSDGKAPTRRHVTIRCRPRTAMASPEFTKTRAPPTGESAPPGHRTAVRSAHASGNATSSQLLLGPELQARALAQHGGPSRCADTSPASPSGPFSTWARPGPDSQGWPMRGPKFISGKTCRRACLQPAAADVSLNDRLSECVMNQSEHLSARLSSKRGPRPIATSLPTPDTRLSHRRWLLPGPPSCAHGVSAGRDPPVLRRRTDSPADTPLGASSQARHPCPPLPVGRAFLSQQTHPCTCALRTGLPVL